MPNVVQRALLMANAHTAMYEKGKDALRCKKHNLWFATLTRPGTHQGDSHTLCTFHQH